VTRPILITNADRGAIRRALDEQNRRVAETAAEEFKQLITDEYHTVLEFFNQSGANPLPAPQIKIDVQIEPRRTFIYLQVSVVITEGGAEPHRLYYILSLGTKDRIQSKTSPPIPERAGLATTPNSLAQPGFQGFTGRTFRIPRGTAVQGIPARNWDRLLGEKVAAMANTRTFAGLQWEVKHRFSDPRK
jgi:hypothetical protein